ncbi:hypothetical protein AFL46_10060 [Providencia stuartii]|nr:hypothetical protein AFL46_10060 [Providencia stuartii]
MNHGLTANQHATKPILSGKDYGYCKSRISIPVNTKPIAAKNTAVPPLAVIVKQPSGYHYYWHHRDINSAPLDVTNEQGNTVWSGKYERFGFVRSSPLSFYSDPDRKMESFEQNLRYAGQYFDNETGLHFNTFRFYDPQIGRFIMPDPIGLLGGINLYQYAPNPLMWVNP